MQLPTQNRIKSSTQSRAQRKCPTSSDTLAQGVYPEITAILLNLALALVQDILTWIVTTEANSHIAWLENLSST